MSIKLIINSEKYIIPKISELNVKDYCNIIENNLNVDLISYINFITNKDVIKSNVQCNYTIDDIEKIIFDLDLDFSKIPCPDILNLDGEKYIVKELDDGTFNKRYLLNIYRQRMDQKKFSITQLSIYAIALMLSKTNDINEINLNYEKLLELKWHKVLPIGFFLSKKLVIKKRSMTIFFKQLIIKLKFIVKFLMLKLRRLKILITYY